MATKYPAEMPPGMRPEGDGHKYEGALDVNGINGRLVETKEKYRSRSAIDLMSDMPENAKEMAAAAVAGVAPEFEDPSLAPLGPAIVEKMQRGVMPELSANWAGMFRTRESTPGSAVYLDATRITINRSGEIVSVGELVSQEEMEKRAAERKSVKRDAKRKGGLPVTIVLEGEAQEVEAPIVFDPKSEEYLTPKS